MLWRELPGRMFYYRWGLSEFVQPPLCAVILGTALIILAMPTALLALKRMQKGNTIELIFAILGIVGSGMLVLLLVVGLLESY